MVKLKWQTVQGNQETKPALTDTTSSPTTVYIRKNVKRVLVTQADGNSAYVWQYEEAALTLAEYKEYEALVAELETPAIQALQEQNYILQAALADIYESIAEQMSAQENTNLAILAGLAELYETQEGTVEE